MSNTFLIVDDNPDDFFATRRTLTLAGLDNPLLHLDSGEDALDYLRGQGAWAEQRPARPALILLDVNMPGMKGDEVLREIRRDPELRNLPVLMLTSSNADRDVLAAFQDGANAYLNKPVEFSTLLQAIQRIRTHRFQIALSERAPA